jgi:para-aminobenzoate synthetase/4-amino-4-deoxychorismate lyase
MCPSPHRVLTAVTPAEVVPVLSEVDRATRLGWWAYGYLAYEAAPGLDASLATHPAADGPPLAWFGLCGAPVRVPSVAASAGTGGTFHADRWCPVWERATYLRNVDRIRERIAAGETYQCNYTVRLHSRVTGELSRCYAELALAQRGSYAAYLDLGRFVVASASPELFFEWAGERLTMRPMKGTAARGRNLAEDRLAGDRLRNSDKERAENIMIVDLMRNDVSRIARVGSVSVPTLCAVERYESVLQLTSEVTATLQPGVSLLDVFRALFPCGSVTGAPKARTMELIRELEDTPRGVYCGAVGLVGPPDTRVRARFNVAIRTVVADRATGRAVYGTGGGITWGSKPGAEHEELLVKSAILHRRHEDFDLLETMAQHAGTGIRNRGRHLERMAQSAEYFGFPFDPTRAEAELKAAVDPDGSALLRLRLPRSGALAVEVEPLPSSLGRPVVLAVDSRPVDSADRWLYHKTSRRTPYIASRKRHPGADDVVMLNERGEVTETTIASLAVRRSGYWWTPPVSSGCLPGVERRRLLELGVLRERVLLPTDLYVAEELAVVSSLRGWRQAVLVDGVRGTEAPGEG